MRFRIWIVCFCFPIPFLVPRLCACYGQASQAQEHRRREATWQLRSCSSSPEALSLHRHWQASRLWVRLSSTSFNCHRYSFLPSSHLRSFFVESWFCLTFTCILCFTNFFSLCVWGCNWPFPLLNLDHRYSPFLLLDFRFTELEIAVPDIGIVGLHAENLGIVSVSVDGDPTEFEYYPRTQHVESEKSFKAVSSPTSAADAAGSIYLSSIEKELVPNLLINCCKAFKNGSEKQDQPFLENGVQPAVEDKQVVAVSYCYDVSLIFTWMLNVVPQFGLQSIYLLLHVLWHAKIIVMKCIIHDTLLSSLCGLVAKFISHSVPIAC